MNNAAIANWREQLSANKRSGLNILTDDIKNPMWKVNVPLKKFKHLKSRTLRAMDAGI